MRIARWLAMAVFVGLFLGASTAGPSIPSASAISAGGSVYLPLVLQKWTPPPPPSPESLIDADVASGKLDSQTGLVYKVFAVFGDGRLPSQYRPTTTMKFGDDAMAEARVRFSSLSSANQDLLRPFLLDPYLPGSWYEQRAASASGLSAAASPWKYYDTDTGSAKDKVRVWFTDEVPDGQNKAWQLKLAIENDIWPALVRVMGQEPLVPPNPPNDYGRVSVALVKSLDAYGVTTPYVGCDNTAASVQIDGSQPLGSATSFGVLQITAHELMHATKDSFALKSNGNSCREYSWLSEATSNWFEDVVYPNTNSERVAPGLPDFLETPHLSIDDRTGDRHYGAYTLLYLLSHTMNYPVDEPQARIGQVWREAASLNSIEAFDKVVKSLFLYNNPLGTGPFWARYYRALWNGLPTDLYQQNDKLTDGAVVAADDPSYTKDAPTPVRLDGAPMKTYEMKGDLKHSSSRYYHFTFPDQTVRSVYLYDGILTKLVKDPDVIGHSGSEGTAFYRPGDPPANPDPLTQMARGASFQVLYKIEGQDWQEAPANNAVGVSFCRDAKAERISDLVVILGNTDIARDYTLTPSGEKPVLQVSNVGCWQWSGTVTAKNEGTGTIPWSSTADVTLRSVPMPAGLPYHLPPTPGYIAQTGSVQWEMDYADPESGCSYQGSDFWALTQGADDGTMNTLNGSLSGPWHRGYYMDDFFNRTSSYQVTCPNAPPSTDEVEVDWFDTYNSATPYSVPTVSADGTMLSGSATWGDDVSRTTWTWNLHADREP